MIDWCLLTSRTAFAWHPALARIPARCMSPIHTTSTFTYILYPTFPLTAHHLLTRWTAMLVAVACHIARLANGVARCRRHNLMVIGPGHR